jgi:hypothetical protein
VVDLALPDIDLSAYNLAVGGMTASELMFYYGAPFAHVVRYEQELRGERRRRTQNLSWSRRPYAWCGAAEASRENCPITA